MRTRDYVSDVDMMRMHDLVYKSFFIAAISSVTLLLYLVVFFRLMPRGPATIDVIVAVVLGSISLVIWLKSFYMLYRLERFKRRNR